MWQEDVVKSSLAIMEQWRHSCPERDVSRPVTVFSPPMSPSTYHYFPCHITLSYHFFYLFSPTSAHCGCGNKTACKHRETISASCLFQPSSHTKSRKWRLKPQLPPLPFGLLHSVWYVRFNKAHGKQNKFKCTQINKWIRLRYWMCSCLVKDAAGRQGCKQIWWKERRQSTGLNNKDPWSGRCGPGLNAGFLFTQKSPGVNTIQQRRIFASTCDIIYAASPGATELE